MEKKFLGFDSDRLSNLPDSLIENILLRLPLRDAAKTSVLSTKWLHAWATLPQLLFDYSFCSKITPEQVVLTIIRILLTRRGPLHKFILNLPPTSKLKDCQDIDRIVKYVSQNGIQSLSTPRGYKIPSYLFSCQELKYFRLCQCVLEPPDTFNGLKNLSSLIFKNVVFKPGVIENFFSRFPLLEILVLEQCEDIQDLSIHAPKLKYLRLESVFKSINFRHTWRLKLASIWGLGVRNANVDDGSLVRGVNIVELFDCCRGIIECLEIGYYFLKILAAGYVPPGIATDFGHLKGILFRDICFGVKAEVQCAIWFIRNSPQLQRLTFKLHHGEFGDTDAAMEFLKVLHIDNISFDQLRCVGMKSYRGTNPEIEFVAHVSKITLVRDYADSIP